MAGDIYEINKLTEFFSRRHVARKSVSFNFSAFKNSDISLTNFMHVIVQYVRQET